ncbi:MAG TPA: serine/threonine-protein kinase [Polyangiaceae bacterium]|nr:serine/threonine-protein kinase [Polyangiaceae bacterium]
MDAESLIGQKLGNFRLERVLGLGRMGVVYLARDEALLRPTAVKILSWRLPEQHGLDPEAWFLAEARNAARINHPNVVQIYGVAKHIQQCYIAMEYVTGMAADAWLKKDVRFSVQRATEILIQSASALQAAHDAGVVHRDIKPGNLLITSDGVAKLGDFGMALSVAAEPRAGQVRAGTPFYTAPEIWRGQAASVASDIYALGATYFQLVTGHLPLNANTLEELIAAHLNAPLPDPQQYVPDLPGECVRIIQHCLQKSPTERFTSAQALSWEARGLLRELTSAVRQSAVSPPNLERRSDSPPRRDSKAPATPRSVSPPRPIGSEPFGSISQELRALIADASVPVVLLSGERGSGKTTLARGIAEEYERWGAVAWASANDENKPIAQSLLAGLGGVPAATVSNPSSGIELLLNRLEQGRSGVGPSALLIIDDVAPSGARLSEVAALVKASVTTRAFRLLVVSPPEFRERAGLIGANLRLSSVHVPLLTTQQTLRYLSEWLQAMSAKERVMITPDAALIIAYRSKGNVRRMNQMAASMLEGATLAGRALISSWDAWSAPENPVVSVGAPQQKPKGWPTADVLQILNLQRAAAGLPVRNPSVEIRTVSAGSVSPGVSSSAVSPGSAPPRERS